MIERGFEKAQQLRENQDAVRQFAIQRAMDILRAAGVIDPKLEAVAHSATSVDLRQQTYDLLHRVRQPSEQDRKALVRRGIVFLPLETKSYAQVVAENQGHFWGGELNYANTKPQLRDYALPIAVEAGFNPKNPSLPDSFGRSRPVQLQMIEDYSQQLQAEFPDIRAIMLPSTGYAQADRVYRAKTGKVLIRNYFARALDDLSEVGAAVAGRSDHSGQFNVLDWIADRGGVIVGAGPAVVFVGNQ